MLKEVENLAQDDTAVQEPGSEGILSDLNLCAGK